MSKQEDKINMSKQEDKINMSKQEDKINMSKHKTFTPDAAHLMIDIETLGMQESAVPIIAIAAVPFTMEKKTNKNDFYLWYVEPHPEAKINFETIKFWMQQEKAVQAAAFGQGNNRKIHQCTLEQALTSLIDIYMEHKCETIWCKGLQFDMNNIEFYMQMYKIKRPWHYNDRLDVRPYSRLLSVKEADEIYSRHDAHNPVEDCMIQIETVQSVSAQWEYRQNGQQRCCQQRHYYWMR